MIAERRDEDMETVGSKMLIGGTGRASAGYTRRRNRRGEGGFTLLELLVVLAILGLLAAIAAPRVISYLGSAKSDSAGIQLANIATALDLYRLEIGRYPTQGEGLKALVENPSGDARWNGPYLNRKDAILDPWGQPYQYRLPGEHGEFDVFTLGADGTAGGEGEDRDITSW